jgi:hypothetical protein
MPAEELVELGAKIALRAVSEFPQLIFNRHVARYFHGIGRRLIALLTLGKVRIPSSLRIVPDGQAPKPRRNDWIALGVGIGTWIATFSGILVVIVAA